MTHILYAPHANSRGAKIQITATFLNFPLQLKKIDYTELKTKQYLAKHPLGKVPLLQTPEGYLFESNAILRYIARKAKGLYGNNQFQIAAIDQWLQFTSTQLQPFNYQILGSIFGWKVPQKKKFEASKDQIDRLVKILDAHLKTRVFLVGQTISIADISLATALNNTFRVYFDEKYRQKIPNLTRWYNHISSLPPYQKYYGKNWLCTNQFFVTFQEKVKQQQKQIKPNNQTTNQKTKKQQKKVQVQKKEVPKKQQAKKKKVQQEEEQEQQVEQVKIEKKKVNPLDQLPKSSFNFDDFKRQFSNSPDKSQVIKNLWTKFDPQGFSLWKVRYNKVQGQNTVGWLTCNLKNGVLRNIDHFRKYGFSTGGVYGVQGNYQIQSIWLWRGTDIPLEWKDHQSYDSHIFTKLDHNNEQHKKLIAQYWLNTQQGQLVEGLPVHDVGYFK